MTELSFDEVVRILDQNGYNVVKKSALRDYDRYLDQSEFRYVLWLDRTYRLIENVPGHIVEVGVARGRNSVIFGHLIRLTGDDQVRNYYGFDTFEGYTEDDLRRSPHLGAGEWKATTLEFVQERLAGAKLADICHVFKGDIKQLAEPFANSKQARFNPGKLRIALLYIDCNAYLPAKFSMDFFKTYMAPGGIVCIDEKLQGGETEALIEFCKENGLEYRKDTGPFAMPAYTRIG
ncbi:MAG: class I SAM-dependent methyltransferase [Rhodospirillaceae bacterium]